MLSFRRRARFSQFSDREQAYALALIMVGIVLVTAATVAILIEDAARQDARESARMLGPPAGETPDRSGSRSGLGVAEYVNGTHDYGFEYPASWTVHENAQITSLENPNGRIRVRFGIGPSSDLETTAARSIHSLSDVTSDRDVSRSLRVARSVRARDREPCGRPCPRSCRRTRAPPPRAAAWPR